MKTVLFYEMAPGGFEAARAHFPAHRARLDEFKSRGLVLMAGAFADPAQGAMGIFSSRLGAEEFVRDDPFVVHGVVGGWKLLDWNDVLV